MTEASPPPTATGLNTHHVLKLVAIVAMTLDHIGGALLPDHDWLRVIGRLAIPIFFFLVGHALHYRIKADLVLWMVVMLLLSPLLGRAFFPANILATILCSQLLLRYIEKHQLLARDPWMLCIGACMLIFVTAPILEAGTMGMMFALMGYAVRSGQMGWRTGKLVSFVALGLCIGVQLVIFDFTVLQHAAMVALLVALMPVLMRFRHCPVRVPRPLAVFVRPTIWLSRVSAQYYVVHRLLLQALAMALGFKTFTLRWF
jgi:hypothetical protein